MGNEFHQLEESLKEFLVNAQNDSYNSKSMTAYKYNNLKIYMDSANNKTPHFVVRVGISEGVYNLHSGEKLSGGLGSDERYIRRWFDKGHIKADLSAAWKLNEKAKPVTTNDLND